MPSTLGRAEAGCASREVSPLSMTKAAWLVPPAALGAVALPATPSQTRGIAVPVRPRQVIVLGALLFKWRGPGVASDGVSDQEIRHDRVGAK